ncbi:MAG: hypothetical protein RIF41_19080 [Polyangiaceae bacterium]
MFFGLGPGELLLIAGPKAIPKIFKAAKQAHDVKSKLTGRAVVDYLMDDSGKPTKGGKAGKKTKSKTAREKDA